VELPKDRIINPLVGQIIRSAGSVGANYREIRNILSAIIDKANQK